MGYSEKNEAAGRCASKAPIASMLLQVNDGHQRAALMRFVWHVQRQDLQFNQKLAEISTMRRILVTAGSDFIGSHLRRKLLDGGGDILCLGNYFTLNRKGIAPLFSNSGFEAVRCGITFPLHVEVGETYRFACPASPLHCQPDPGQTTKTSVIGVAFDCLAGRKTQPPPWMQRNGLEWLFRLTLEPRRLFRRCVWIAPGFLVAACGLLLRRAASAFWLPAFHRQPTVG